MPYTRPMEGLKNYEEISKLCHQSNEPVFLTRDGNVDLVVMRIETYERLFEKVPSKADKE